jgi:GNAT superfamily N-acetyltransferase
MSTHIVGPELDAAAACEAVLRSLPAWFGIEEALLTYARDSARHPTFAVLEAGRMVGFLTLVEHFPRAWEIHCLAVHAQVRNKGHGRALMNHAEHWLSAQGVSFLQVKTIAATRADAHYAATRAFYTRLGFAPLEVFPALWSPANPCLQMIKVLESSTAPDR